MALAPLRRLIHRGWAHPGFARPPRTPPGRVPITAALRHRWHVHTLLKLHVEAVGEAEVGQRLVQVLLERECSRSINGELRIE